MPRFVPLVLLCAAALLPAGDVDALLARAAHEPDAAIAALTGLSRHLAILPPAEAAVLGDRIDPLARRLFLEGWDLPQRDQAGLATVAVQAGDTLGRIARQRRTTVDLLVRLNPGVDPRRLRVGDRLTVLDTAAVPLRIEVAKSSRRLGVWRGPLLALWCPVGIGAGSTPTPTGSTTLALRVKDPEWRDPATGRVHPPRSPGNMLGGWWLGFAPGGDGRFRSIGFHGWTGSDPSQWLEREGSRGCIRMRQADIADLYALVVPGVAIAITD